MSNDNIVVTPPALCSYVFVLEKREDMSGKEVYSCRLIFDKQKQAAAIERMREQLVEFGRNNFGKARFKLPFRDGDAELANGDIDDELYKGKVFFNTKTTREVQLRKRLPNGELIEVRDPEEWYSGIIAKAVLTPYAWEHKQGGKGVSLSLNGLIKLADGPSLVPQVDVEEALAEHDTGDDEIPFETIERDEEDEIPFDE